MSRIDRNAQSVLSVLMLCAALSGCSNAMNSYSNELAPGRKSAPTTGVPGSFAEQQNSLALQQPQGTADPRQPADQNAFESPRLRPLPEPAERRIMGYGARYTLAVPDVTDGALVLRRIRNALADGAAGSGQSREHGGAGRTHAQHVTTVVLL